MSDFWKVNPPKSFEKNMVLGDKYSKKNAGDNIPFASIFNSSQSRATDIPADLRTNRLGRALFLSLILVLVRVSRVYFLKNEEGRR